MKKIKIIYLISHLQSTGPVNILYGIIKNLDRTRFEPYLITLKSERKDSREKDFENLKIKIIKNPTENLKIILKRDQSLENKIKEINPQILHAHCLASTILISRIISKDIKKISTIHCDFSTDFIYRFGYIKGYILRNIYTAALNKLDLNISCGREVGRLNQLHANIKSISVMNGIDEERIKLENIVENKEQIRKKLKIPLNKKIFITVSSIDEGKNILFLARIFKEKLKEYIFIILGDGNKRKELEKLIKGSKNIYYFGKKSSQEVQYFLKGSDFYISASKSEGMPNSVLEALQFQLLLILSDIGPHKEILEINTSIGLVFKNEDIKDISEKINKIVNLKHERSEFEEVQKKISAKRMTKDYIRIYEKMIGSNKL